MHNDKSLKNEEVYFDESQELVSTTDLKGVITYVNQEFCSVAGYSAQELIGQHHILFVTLICQKRPLKKCGQH